MLLRLTEILSVTQCTAPVRHRLQCLAGAKDKELTMPKLYRLCEACEDAFKLDI